MAPPKPPAIAALHVGHRAMELAAITSDHRVCTVRAAPNPPLVVAEGPTVDVVHVWRWLVAALGSLAERFRIEAIVPIAQARTVAVLDEHELRLPLRLGDGALLPRLPRTPPSGARWLLAHAQYWGWRLTGGAVATEVSGLGEASGLVEPASGRPTSALRASGWHQLLPARMQPHEVLGRLAAEVAERAELPPTTPVLVGAGSLAAQHGRLLAAGLDSATLVAVDDADVCRLVAGGAAAPAIVGLDGRPLALLCVDDAGPTVRAPEGLDGVALRGALVLDRALDRIASRGAVVVEGALAADAATLGLLAALRAPRGQAVFAGRDPYPMAQAASLLAGWRQRRPPPRLDLVRVAAAEIVELEAVKAGWRGAIGD